ncbi:MAG: PEP-CTERM sorting domain-containing protein [Phycisphaerales bacterium]
MDRARRSCDLIETVSVTGPGTLEVYEGGQSDTSVVLPQSSHTLDPILSIGQPWKWFDPVVAAGNVTLPFPASGSGLMVHNWYATATPGLYEVQYRVYVGDATTGVADSTYTAATVSLSWTPEPATLAILSLGVLWMVRRDKSAS